MNSALESFAANMYNTLKTPKKTSLVEGDRPAQLELDLDSGDRKVFVVSPIHAILILHFHGYDSRNLHDLASTTSLPIHRVKSTVAFGSITG